MTADPKPAAIAKRELSLRIERYLSVMEKRAVEPGQRAGYHLLQALTHLQEGSFQECERHMILAGVATTRSDASEMHPAATVQTLRDRLRAIPGE